MDILSVVNKHLIFSNDAIIFSFIQQFPIPLCQMNLRRNLLFRWMTMEYIIISFARRARPNMTIMESEKKISKESKRVIYQINVSSKSIKQTNMYNNLINKLKAICNMVLKISSFMP